MIPSNITNVTEVSLSAAWWAFPLVFSVYHCFCIVSTISVTNSFFFFIDPICTKNIHYTISIMMCVTSVCARHEVPHSLLYKISFITSIPHWFLITHFTGRIIISYSVLSTSFGVASNFCVSEISIELTFLPLYADHITINTRKKNAFCCGILPRYTWLHSVHTHLYCVHRLKYCASLHSTSGTA